MPPARSGALVFTLFADRRNLDLEGIAWQLHDALLQCGERPVLRLVGGQGRPLPSPEALADDIEQLAERGTVVIVAIRGPFLQEVLVAFDHAHRSIAFTDGCVPSVRDLRRMLRLTASLGLGVDRVAAVLLEGCAGALDTGALGSALQRDVLAVLPGPDSDPGTRRKAYRAFARQLVDDCRPAPNGNP
jgi:hypothetical protein